MENGKDDGHCRSAPGVDWHFVTCSDRRPPWAATRDK